ncbi:MAG: PAS domain S-box protein [Nitrospirae bacterium]|nr:PAS domain S-box protein [Nitrospirota bacterium]
MLTRKVNKTEGIILVVEDDKGVNNLIVKTLQDAGHNTVGVFTGREAVTNVTASKVSLMVLDYKLQDMSGKQVIELLAKEGFEIPFIVVTGFGDEKIAVEMMKLGAADYIVKNENLMDILPFRVKKVLKEVSHEKIVKTIDSVLEKSEANLKSILTASPNGIGLLQDRQMKWVSERFVELVGYSEDELVGNSTEMFYDEHEEFERVGRALYDDIARKGRGEVDTQCRRKDGTYIDVYIQVAPTNPDNLDMGVIFSFSDITERKRYEKELFESKRDWEEVFDSVTDMITVHDIDFNIIRANKAAEQILHLPVLQDMKAKCFEYYHGTACPPEGCPSCNCLKTGKPATFEVFEPHLNKFIEIRSMPRFDKENKLIGLIHVVRDITQRKKMEDGIFESEEKLRTIIDSANDAIISIDGCGKIIFFNTATEDIFGYSADELAGQCVTMLMPERFRDAHQNGLDRVAGGGESHVIGKTVEMAGLRKDGKEFPLEISVAKWQVKGEDFFTGIIKDITERNRSRKLIRESEERYRELFENTSDLIQSLDTEGKFIFVNSSWLKTLGYTREEIDKISIFDILHPSCLEKCKDVFIKVMSCESNDNVEAVFVSRDGRLIDVEGNIRCKFVNGKPIAVQGIFRDVTERNRSEELVQRQLKRINALHSIDMAITSSIDLRVTLNIFLEQVITQLDLDAAAVLLLDEASMTLRYFASKGFRSAALKHANVRMGESYAGRAAKERHIISIPNLKDEPSAFKTSEHFSKEEFVTYFAVPLIAKGQVKGVLEIFKRTLFNADDEWLDFFNTVATQGAIAIDDATLFEDLKRSNVDLAIAYDSTIEGWARALDLRDKETEGHSRRVTEITISLARELGVKEEDIIHIKRGALLHDIGKMGIPDNILLKPGKLTDEEWRIMKNHPNLAHGMIYPVEYLRPALDIPFSHHEKWDGSGYPNGLKGNEIPLAARIFAIIDVWDALSSDRPYRKAWPKEKIIEYIRSESGIHFDPDIVETFLNLISTIPEEI